MRLLIPSVDKPIGYGLAYALRGHSDRIVGVQDPRSPSYIGKSRLCDRVIPLPIPRRSWLQTDLGDELTAEETDYVGRLTEICAAEDIDVVFPASCDITLSIMAKAKARLSSDAGVTVVASDYEAWVTSTDKYSSTEQARKAGFPCPRTFLCETDEEIRSAAGELGFPLVVKARLSTGSRRVLPVTEPDLLMESVRRVSLFSRSVVVQEYIPGSRERSLNFVIDGGGDIVLSYALQKMHYLGSSISTAVRILDPPDIMEAAAGFLRALGLQGFVSIQTKIDARDGQWKLIEVNPRFGNNARIMFRFGTNLALLCLRIAQGQSCPPAGYHPGRVGVSPVEDFMALGAYLRERLRRDERDGDPQVHHNPFPTLAAVAKSYLRTYAGRFTVDYYLASLLRDPSVSFGYYRSLWRSRRAEPRHFVPWGDLQ